MSEVRAEDRDLKPVKVGDVVSFVYGGEHHTMTVDAIEEGMGAQWHLKGTIEVAIVAGSARVQEKDPDEAQGPELEEPVAAAEEPAVAEPSPEAKSESSVRPSVEEPPATTVATMPRKAAVTSSKGKR